MTTFSIEKNKIKKIYFELLPIFRLQKYENATIFRHFIRFCWRIIPCKITLFTSDQPTIFTETDTNTENLKKDRVGKNL